MGKAGVEEVSGHAVAHGAEAGEEDGGVGVWALLLRGLWREGWEKKWEAWRK